MLGRVIAIGIVAFWLVMMTLLIRSELLHTDPLSYSVPIATVMQKMFEGEESSDLTIFYQGKRVGTCSFQVTKDRSTNPPQYSVKSELTLDFEMLGRSIRLRSWTDSAFDKGYQMTRFLSQTTTGDTRIDLKGDLASRLVEFELKMGNGVTEKHTLPFSSIEQMGPIGALGLFGMGGLHASGTTTGPKETPSWLNLNPGGGPTTVVQDTPLRVGNEKLQALMVHTRYDDSLWSKVYVSPVGEVLKVETSFGVMMWSSQLAISSLNP